MKFLALIALSAIAFCSALPVPGRVIVDASNAADEFAAKNEFESFKTKFGKTYETQTEEDARYGVFRSNLVRIATLNAANGAESFGINQFSDLSAAEFAKQKLGFVPSMDANSQQRRMTTPVFSVGDADVASTATTVDWRTKGAVSAVKDQGQCGSCWAFSATEQIESAWFLAKNTLPNLAPQQIVSCDTTDAGCNGGDTPTAYAYVQSAGGLDTASAYPYTSGSAGASGKCKFIAGSIGAKISGFTYATKPCTDSCTSQDETTFATNIAAHGPASICVNAANWQLYSSGVLTASACGGGAYSDLDHCVQVVGFNDAAAKPYWLVRNSWGSSWGNAGYIYVEKGTNACGVADEATFVTI